MNRIRGFLHALARVSALSAVPLLVAPLLAADLALASDLLPPWRIEPPQPCPLDEVRLVVRGFVATPCDSFLGVAQTFEGIVVRRQVKTWMRCFAAPSVFYDVPVSLGHFATGSHQVALVEEIVNLNADGSADTSRARHSLAFTVTDICRVPPVTELPLVDSARTEPIAPCSELPTTLVLSGAFLPGCGAVTEVTVIDPSHVRLVLDSDPVPGVPCPAVLLPWRAAFPLGLLPPGPHRVEVELVLRNLPWREPGDPVDRVLHGFWAFDVSAECRGLPFVDRIVIGSSKPCTGMTTQICPTDSIQVFFAGTFPNGCYSFEGIEILESPIMAPGPHPPLVRVIVDDHACELRLCPPGPTPWFATAMLPPLPTGGYYLLTELAWTSCSDEIPPDKLFRTTVPFAVARGDSCGRRPGLCLVSEWDHSGRIGGCDATISEHHPATVTFGVAPTTALAGLQGSFAIFGTGFRAEVPRGFKIAAIEPVGAAAGMKLSWSTHENVAEFVLLAQSGAPIPAADPGRAEPILRVTLEMEAGASPSPLRVQAYQLLGSDIEGNGVPECPPLPCADGRLILDAAFVCVERECDFNADGHADIRDLVLMVHCANGSGACPDDVVERFDCDDDQNFGFPDVWCCAAHILRERICPDCPPDSVRPEPSVHLALGAPVATGDGFELPLRLSGVDRLGAARLSLAFPGGNFRVASIQARNLPAGWTHFSQESDGRLFVGLIAGIPLEARAGLARAASGDRAGTLQSGAPAPGAGTEIELLVTLERVPGGGSGGRIEVDEAEFAGPDGVRVDAEIGRPSQPLGSGAPVSLSQSRPNPFSRRAEFTVSLERAGQLELAIFDLSGRRIRTVFSGPREAGEHLFSWDGRTGSGEQAADGVYFYRAVVDGQAQSRRMVLLRSQ